MLTDTQVRATKPGERARRLADRDGLYLQIEPSGGRYWRFNYRFNGKQNTLALGVYSDVSLAKARRRLREEKGTRFLRQYSRSGRVGLRGSGCRSGRWSRTCLFRRRTH